MALPLSRIDTKLENSWLRYNRFGLFSFYDRDHGFRDGSSLEKWARTLLRKEQVSAEGEIILITMPRVLGYVFNPVSFYFCHDTAGRIKAVICEVNNTFGETHSYLCLPEPGKEEIEPEDLLTGEKLFHVSPFLERQGEYRFRFRLNEKNAGIWIDHIDKEGKPLLLTAVTGQLTPLNTASLRRAFFSYPLLTFRAIFLIHWHAIKLFLKGTRYISKPLQIRQRTSKTTTNNN
jgi:DUF1365 family protein